MGVCPSKKTVLTKKLSVVIVVVVLAVEPVRTGFKAISTPLIGQAEDGGTWLLAPGKGGMEGGNPHCPGGNEIVLVLTGNKSPVVRMRLQISRALSCCSARNI